MTRLFVINYYITYHKRLSTKDSHFLVGRRWDLDPIAQIPNSQFTTGTIQIVWKINPTAGYQQELKLNLTETWLHAVFTPPPQ